LVMVPSEDMMQMVVVSRETSKAAKRGWFSIGNAPLKGKRPSIGRPTPNDRIFKTGDPSN
ncbi:MAG: hypothetical protein ABW003_04540, partial [Microvirga sp.]